MSAQPKPRGRLIRLRHPPAILVREVLRMDAKTELERRLVGLAPGMEAEIRQALEAYRFM